MHRQELELWLQLCYPPELLPFFIHSDGSALSLGWQPDVQGRGMGFQAAGAKGQALDMSTLYSSLEEPLRKR